MFWFHNVRIKSNSLTVYLVLELRCHSDLQDEGVAVKETYLGLNMPEHNGVPGQYLKRLADLVDSSVDLEALLVVAATATPPFADEAASPTAPLPASGDAVTIAVARDAAFGFYYRECVPFTG